jgi:uncharacterized protein (TIGR03435 family)
MPRSVLKLRFCGVAAVLAWALISVAQCQENPAHLTFDVASIRPSQPGLRGGGMKPLPGGNGYTVINIPVKLMISLMYKVPMRHIEGGADWLNTDFYEIEARTDHPASIDDLHTMFQNLLADRFNLKFHKEMKEGPVYALTVEKSGLKMTENQSGQDLKIPITFGAGGEANGVRVPMQYLCWWLGQQLQRDERPVIDKTGLDKSYNFTLSFAPELPPDVPRDSLPPELRDRPSIFDAVKEQLGLKLTPEKGPIENIVIDHVERPSEN